MYRIAYLLLSSVLFWACSDKEKINLPYYNEPDFTPIFVKEKLEIERKITHKIDDFSFFNQEDSISFFELVTSMN